MTTPVLICDDSGMARKQMARALPADWDVQLSYASDGDECLEILRAGLGDVLFLDLNMPVLDGYGVLEVINREDLPTLVIVVSGDIQPEARERVSSLGALDFIKKPTDPARVSALLEQFGLYRPQEADSAPSEAGALDQTQVETASGSTLSMHDCLQELANVAMGRAGDLLARLLKVFVKMPIPKVNTLEASELRMALSAAEASGTYSAVCQGFIGAGIAGEALLLFADTSFEDIATPAALRPRIGRRHGDGTADGHVQHPGRRLPQGAVRSAGFPLRHGPPLCTWASTCRSATCWSRRATTGGACSASK